MVAHSTLERATVWECSRPLSLCWYDKSMTTTLKVVQLSLDKLTLFSGNARRGDVDKIAESLFANGQYKPIVVNVGTHTGIANEVLAGNHTVEAARSLGWDKIQAVTVDVDRPSAVRINVVDNRASDVATDDTADLVALLKEIDTLDGTGFNDDELAQLVASLEGEQMDDGGDADVDDLPLAFGVVVECRNEREQATLLDRFIGEGLTVRALM